jgi:hypothetical protein
MLSYLKWSNFALFEAHLVIVVLSQIFISKYLYNLFQHAESQSYSDV